MLEVTALAPEEPDKQKFPVLAEAVICAGNPFRLLFPKVL